MEADPIANKDDFTNKQNEEKDFYDDLERKQRKDFELGNRRTPLSNNVLMLLGDLLQPQTTGFSWVNMDMAFTQLDYFGVHSVRNSNFLILYFTVNSMRRALYLERGNLACQLVVSRSLNAKSMDLFTHTVTQQKSEFLDKTEKKTPFTSFFGKKKESET